MEKNIKIKPEKRKQKFEEKYYQNLWDKLAQE